ncbi:unannotated protein [freshwater metagenome]|uniref:Unannotated protein n=1 Tax=freshwater metagenome TaxID=449393 RepID=A0A6J7J391_9ZZZZ
MRVTAVAIDRYPRPMSNRNLIARSALAIAIVIAVTGSLLTLSPLPAGAHAIIDLQSSDAIVGRTSAMTLEIQHGCINGGGGTVKFVAQFAAAFGAVTAGSVPGWTSVVTSGITTTTGTTTTTAEGQTVTWTTNGAAQPFSTALVVPLTVRWPYRAGAYGIVVSQTCSNPADETVWSTPAQPAIAGVPSPPLTPLATVCVLPARLAKSSTWPKRTTRTIERLCSTLR